MFPKHRVRLAIHYHGKLFQKWQWHVILVKVALKRLCPCAGPQVLNKEITTAFSEGHQARSGRAVAPSVHGALRGQAPLC